MSVFRILWYFIELLISIYLAAGTETSYAWGIVFLAFSKILLKYKTFPFLFLQCLNISIAYFRKRCKDDPKPIFGELLKALLKTRYPKETLSYFRRYTDSMVYFFTRASARGDEESSDEEGSRKGESSQQRGEGKEVASDRGTEKQDPDLETNPTASRFSPSKSIRKRKGDSERENSMKRSKFEERPVEKGIDCAQVVESSSTPGRGCLAGSSDKPQPLLSDSFSQDTGATSSAEIGGTGMEQVVTKPDPDETASIESMLLSPPSEKTPPLAKNSNSEDSSPGERMIADTAAKAVESKLFTPEEIDHDSRKKSCSCKGSSQGDNSQRAEVIPPVETRDSVENRDILSRNANRVKIPSPRSVVSLERRHVTMGDKCTVKELPDVVTSSSENRLSKEIAQVAKEFFKKCYERSEPKDPRMSGRNRTGGNTRRPGDGSIRIQYDDIVTHPLFRSWPRADRPGPSSDLGCITIYYHKDSRGKTQYYREYPGLSLQPLTVKKDANYQKRFYRHQRSMIMPIKMGEMIQWCIKLSQDLICGIPRYPTADEDKLSLEEYHELSQQLMQAIVRAYKSVQEGGWKNRRAKKRSTERRKTNYASSSFQEESPSDSSSDETIYMHSLPKISSGEDLSEICDAPISPSKSERPPMNLQLPDFSFECNSSRVLAQRQEFFQAIAPEFAKLSMSHNEHRNYEQSVNRYDSYSNPRASLQPVEIKFVPETSRNSTRFVYCRDNMSFDRGEDSRIRLKPFFEVEKVLHLEGRWPSVSVEEFLQTLLTLQELYYQMLFDESERFYTFREQIYRCVIPMRNIEDDEANPKPTSSKSVVSYGEVSSTTSETNIPGRAVSINVEGKAFGIGSAADTSACKKKKHIVWYPPTIKEAEEDARLDSPPDNSETESASE